MKKIFFFLFFLIFITNAYGEIKISTDEKVNRFYDRLMALFSYDKIRDFYEEHINTQEISYDDFINFIKGSGITIGGTSESKLVGWDKKGNNVKITVELVYKNRNSKKERIILSCVEKADRIIIPIKEFKKIYTVKRGKK